ncbi:MAG TPA: condensation domain-containing protein, partial [Thermoanaerobaculia bacterium]
LRAALARELPEFMVPSAFVFLEALPLSPNGKLDRKALPAPQISREGEEYRPPRTPLEEVMAGIWAEVLGVDRVGLGDSFFELGGQSLKAAQVVARLRSVLGIELALRSLFEASRLEDLVRRAEAALGQGQTAPPLVRVTRDRDLPLSFSQERLWLLDRLDPDSPVYNLPVAWRLEGELSIPALEAAFAEIVRRHEALRTVFDDSRGTPVQVVLPPAAPSLPVVDLRGLPEGPRTSEARRLTMAEGRRPFDLKSGPLLRQFLLATGDREHVLLLRMHHIVSDGWTLGVLAEELASLYRSALTGEPASLPELPVQYPDYAVWQREWLQDEALEGLLGHWRERLAGAAALDLPTDRPRPAVRLSRGGRIRFAVPGGTARAVTALGRRTGATPFMVLLAAFQTLLYRLTGQEDVVVGTPVAGRDRVELEPLIGFFVNMLPLRSRVSGEASFSALLGRVRETTLQAYAHQALPFERLVEELQPVRDLARTPLFQAMFVFQNTPRAAMEMPGLSRTQIPVETGVAKLDLTLAMAEEGAELAGVVEYDATLFDAATMHRLTGRLVTLLFAVSEDAGRSLSGLPLLLEAERQQLTREWNDTSRDYGRERCLEELLVAQAEVSPDAVAVAFEGAELTYRDLHAWAGRLARRLRRWGVGPEVRVGVCMERSLEMMVALVGILRAGAAYVPLDPEYPQDRLAYMLEDARAEAILTQERLVDRLPRHEMPVILLDREDLAGEDELPASGAMPDNPAYVIYTSGSTGRPKGVVVPHRGVVNRLLWGQGDYGLTPADRVLQKTPFSFDVSVWEFFWPLLIGARLV